MENFRDAELKKWLAEEYEKETEEMEKILFPDGVIPDDGETEEEAKAAYQRLVEKLKADGVYKEDETDSIKTDDHKENVKIVYLPEKKSHKAARVAAAVPFVFGCMAVHIFFPPLVTADCTGWYSFLPVLQNGSRTS